VTIERYIPPLLQADLLEDCATLTYVLQIVATGGQVCATSGLDEDLTFDTDTIPGVNTAPFTGLGELTYLADPGYEADEIEHANDLSVDGTDGRVLVPLAGTPFNAEDIRAGVWDDARFRVLVLNYEALDHGYYELLSGYVGDITLRDDALLVIQLDGPTRALRQTMCWRDSIRCRAPFGSQESEEIEYCGFDVSSLWIAFTVTAVDPDDSSRSFADSSLGQAAGFFVPGGVLWDTGDNAGNSFRGIDTHQTGGVIGLRDPMPKPIQVGDTGRIRTDCTKDREGPKGCRSYFGDDWVLHMRAEPDTPLDGTAMTPGATLGPGRGGATSILDAVTDPE